MISVAGDQKKNRIFIQIKGKLELTEAKTAGKQLIAEIYKLKPGFGLVSDLTEFSPAAEDARLELEGAMKKVKNLCGGHAVHIASAQSIVAANQWQRTLRAAGFFSDQVNSLAEAEQILTPA